jgi:hypothetical protein
MNGIVKWLKDKRDNILIPNTLTTAVFDSEGKNVDELLDDKVSKEAGKGLFSGSYNDLTDVPTLVAGENITIKDNRYNTNDATSNTIKISSSVDKAIVSDITTGCENLTITNSVDGSIIYLNNAGYTKQHVFDGKVTTTTNGIKNTNPIPCKQGDSITMTVSTGLGAITVYNANNEPLLAIPQLSEPPSKTETFTIDVDVTGIIIDVETTATTMEIKVNGSIYAQPTPDAPIRIGGLADKGYFDGELMLSSELLTDAISNKNPFTCKAGDVIKVMYEDVVDNFSMRLIDTGGQAWDYNLSNVNEMEWTMPLDAQEVYFYIKDDTISSVADAKHICVTINGMYAVGVKTINEEGTQYTEALIPVSSPLYDGDYIEVYADGTGQIYRKMGSVVFDGSDDEVWEMTSADKCTYRIDKLSEKSMNNANQKCNHYVYSFSYSDNTFKVETNVLHLRDLNITSVEELKTKLADSPITVVYQKATPTSTPLTAEQVAEFRKLQTFKGVTHITVDGEVTVRYYCNNASGDTVAMLQNGLNNKSDINHKHNISDIEGLENVDNTSDVDKPISTATQTALDKKANLASPTLIGTPKAPTASVGTNTTQIATTAFVQTAVANLVDSAPETLNTLGELADAIEEHRDVTDALDAAITNKLDKSGGTISNANTRALTIERTTTGAANIQFKNSNGALGAIGMNAVDGSIIRYTADSSANKSYTVLDTGNYKDTVTPANIGALSTSGDSKSNTVTFTSSDVADGSATAWTSVTKLATGITHATFFARVSQMFKNVRYLYKVLGTTDISGIGDGTVKDAISVLNSNLTAIVVNVNSSLNITMPDNKTVGVLFVSIGTTANAYILKYNNISTNMTGNATPYIEATYNSIRSYTVKNTNTGSSVLGILIMI